MRLYLAFWPKFGRLSLQSGSSRLLSYTTLHENMNNGATKKRCVTMQIRNGRVGDFLWDTCFVILRGTK